MLFLKIYVAFSLLTFVLIVTQGWVIWMELKRKYPDITKKFTGKNKKNMLEIVFNWIRSIVCCFVPIINIGIFYASLFMLEEVKEKALKGMIEDIKEGF